MRLWVRAHDVVRASSSRFSAKKSCEQFVVSKKNIESLLVINYLSPKMDHAQQRGQTKTTLLALPEVKQKQKRNKSICLFKSFLIQSKKNFGISRERESQNFQCTWSQRTTGAVDASNWGKQVKDDKEKIQNKLEGERNKEKDIYMTQMWYGGETKSIFSQQRGFTIIHLDFHTFKHSQQLGRTKRTC